MPSNVSRSRCGTLAAIETTDRSLLQDKICSMCSCSPREVGYHLQWHQLFRCNISNEQRGEMNQPCELWDDMLLWGPKHVEREGLNHRAGG